MQALDTYRGETDTKGNNKKTEEQTWICTVQSLLFQSHDGRHAISTLQHIHLRLTHFQCSQYHELQSMLQIPSRLPREYESPSPDHRTRDTVVVTLFSDTITCCTFINVFVTESVIPWYATSRFTDVEFPQQAGPVTSWTRPDDERPVRPLEMEGGVAAEGGQRVRG